MLMLSVGDAHGAERAETKTILRRTLMSIAASKGFELPVDPHRRYHGNHIEMCGCFSGHEPKLVGSIHQMYHPSNFC
jgi:hypothetical protein